MLPLSEIGLMLTSAAPTLALLLPSRPGLMPAASPTQAEPGSMLAPTSPELAPSSAVTELLPAPASATLMLAGVETAWLISSSTSSKSRLLPLPQLPASELPPPRGGATLAALAALAGLLSGLLLLLLLPGSVAARPMELAISLMVLATLSRILPGLLPTASNPSGSGTGASSGMPALEGSPCNMSPPDRQPDRTGAHILLRWPSRIDECLSRAHTGRRCTEKFVHQAE